jgi:hypothetical protein
MTQSKSKQPEDQPKTHEHPENPAKPKVPTKASSRPVPKGFVVDNSPGQQIFIGGLPGKPTKATRASSWPLPKGCVVVDDKPQSHIFVGGFPCAPPKKPK